MDVPITRGDAHAMLPRDSAHAHGGRSIHCAPRVTGAPLDRASDAMSPRERDRVGARLLWLSLSELCRFRFMQTDPNWSNFLYDAVTPHPRRDRAEIAPRLRRDRAEIPMTHGCTTHPPPPHAAHAADLAD